MSWMTISRTAKSTFKRPTLAQSFSVSDLDREFWDLLLPIS
jgi:hypothetical protein